MITVTGHHQPPEAWGPKKDSAEARNAVSIVLKLSYKGKCKRH